jgi:hypothetical protein
MREPSASAPSGPKADYWDGRFDEWCWEVRRHDGLAVWRFVVSHVEDVLWEAQHQDRDRWTPDFNGWTSLLRWSSDSELLALPGMGLRRLRALRGIAPRFPWVTEPDGEPHRDRLKAPPSRVRHPWWLR